MDAEPAMLGPDARWDALKQRLPKMVGSLLMDARLAEVKEGLVRIELRYPAHAELMQKASNRETLLAAVREIFGANSRVELAGGETKRARRAPAPARSAVAIAYEAL